MEQVVRLTSSNAQLAPLVAGRDATAVAAAWSAASGVTGVAQTYPASGSSGAQTVPLTQVSSRGGTDFTSTVLIGTCYQPVSGGACTTVAGYTTDPAPAAVSGKTRLIRAIVTVTYPGACGATSGCRYTVMSLFDTRGDLVWETK